MFLEVVVTPGPAGCGEQKGQGLDDFALVGLAAGRVLVAARDKFLCETHQGLGLHVGLKPGIEGIQDTAASLCQQRLPLENISFKASFNCKII